MSTTEKRHYSLFPKTLEDCVERLTRPVMKAQGMAGTRILTQWGHIVGPQLARHTFPEKISFPKGKKNGGTLVISTENGFATELQHMQPIIIERLATYFGYQAVNRIVISHTWPYAPKKDALPPKPTLRREDIKLTEQVVDYELKEALASLAKTLAGQNT